MPREIITDWQTVAGSGFASVMYFDTQHTQGQQRTAVANMWAAFAANQLSNTVHYAVRTDGRELNDTTGQLEGLWSEALIHTGQGQGTGQPVADATQVLIQWHTAAIINGRLLRGRTFVPGMGAVSLAGGNILTGAVTVMQTATQALVNAGVGFGVWHRPVQFAGGSFAPVANSTVWPELAVLRRRRR